MKKETNKIISTWLAFLLSIIVFAQAPTGSGIGELKNQYTCKIEGYTIKVYRPANVPANASTRQIHVETNAKSFYATWTELSVLLGYANLVQSYDNLGLQNNPPYNYCDRNGLKIIGQTAYYVQIQNDKNYTGYTVDLMNGSDLDVAQRSWLVQVFNQNKVQHHIDEIPVGCVEGCVGQGGNNPDDPGDTPGSGGYTQADGTVIMWDFDDWLFGGSGPTITVGGVVEFLNQDFNKPGGNLGCINGVMVDFYTHLLRGRKFSIGIKASGAYHDHGGLYCWGSGSTEASDLTNPIPVGQGLSEVSFHEGDEFNQTRWRGGLGLQLNYNLTKRLMLSASAQAGFLSTNQKPYMIMQQTRVGEESFWFPLLEQEEVNHSALFFSPGMRLHLLVNRFLSFYAGIDYSFGQTSSYNSKLLIPQGNPNDIGSYSINQLLNGRVEVKEVQAKNQFMEVSFGISFNLSKR